MGFVVSKLSYITNGTGKVSQHMEYMPFGETLVDEHLNSYNTPFKFNGKEFDEETGNYYYGARYYDPKWSIFISVDPLAEKYPNWSSYVYCFNNPINFIDPTGMESEGWVTTIDDKGNETHTYNADVNTCEEAEAAGYKNVTDVRQAINVSAKDGSYSMNLNSDGSVTNALWGDKGVSLSITDDLRGTLTTAGGTTVNTSTLFSDRGPKGGGAITQMDFSSPFFVAGALLIKIIKCSDLILGTPSKVEEPDFVVTEQGVAIPQSGGNYQVPRDLVSNPHSPPGTTSYGKIEKGKFKESLRIDPATPAGRKGPNYSHYHKDGKGKHYSPNGKDKDPGF